MMPLKATNNALAHCDNAAHGYCFHLDEDEGMEALSPQERKEWLALMRDGYVDDFEDIAAVDEEIKDAQYEYDRATEAADEAQDHMDRLYELKRLLEKKLKPIPVPQRTDPPMIELGVLAEGAV